MSDSLVVRLLLTQSNTNIKGKQRFECINFRVGIQIHDHRSEPQNTVHNLHCRDPVIGRCNEVLTVIIITI